MKIYRIALLAALTSSTAFAQIYTHPSSGDVGIGTTAPGHKLDVMGNIHTPHAGIFGDGHWSTDGFNYEALSTFGGATIRGNAMVVGKFSIGTWTQSAQPNGLFVAGVSIFDNNVGIGTASPVGRLDVSGIPDGTSVFFRSMGRPFVDIKGGANSYKSLRFSNVGNDSDYRWDLNVLPGNDATNPDGIGWWNSTSGQVFTMKTNGNVGIGTIAPRASLSLGNATGKRFLSYDNGSSLQMGIGVDLSGSGGREMSIFAGDDGTTGLNGGHISFGLMTNATIYTEYMRLAQSGNVGIGTSNPTHKLAVNGTIKAKEVIVETTGWSDYVFADGYRLAPLSEVEAHIKTNKHLPGIPSAAQVAETGVNLGDVQSALLAKVEELTLHLIAQEKHFAAQQQHLAAQQAQLTAQQQAMQSLQRENSALQTRLQQLEAR